MFDLAEVIAAVQETEAARGHTLLIYGDPKTGKTQLAATIAKIDWVRTVHYFGLENGHDTIIRMAKEGKLSPEAIKKIKIYRIIDTPDKSRGMDIALKCFVLEQAGRICKEHGAFQCTICPPKVPKSLTPDHKSTDWIAKSIPFDVKELSFDDWVIFDGGKQLGASCLAYITKGKDYSFKPGWDEYGPVFRMLTDICSYIQAAGRCNYIMIAHQMVLENNEIEEKDKFYPQMGSKNFSLTVGSYFGTVIRLVVTLRKHGGASASTASDLFISGSRLGMRLEDEKEPDLSLVWPKLGLKRPTATAPKTNIPPVPPVVTPK